MSERLQKMLARAGYGSRREIESWIAAGRISVDGEVAHLGQRVSGREHIRVDGRTITLTATLGRQTQRTLLYHKPLGELTTRSDPEGRPTIFEHLPVIRTGRWITVGRLDLNTAGLLLVTTDGELANRLMHPSYEIDREYAVRVLGEVGEQVIERLLQGVKLEDGMAAFASIEDAGGRGANHWYHVTLKEGRNREVRRLWESQGVQVSRLIRVRFGPVSLPRGLRPGKFRELVRQEVNALYRSVDLKPPRMPREGTARRKGKLRGR
ncbi:MAG: 23S rRNA pseudouridine(2605) synthase RluB [Gammaproteobacteria bacterium]|nr:MAG: 23S rRNA pseudouridine(2605) synthase RluB [Gammaproteobacteria bacterium]